MNELFKSNEMEAKSPRQKWMEKYGVHTKKRTDLGPDEGEWEAWIGEYKEALDKCLESPIPPEANTFVWAFTEQDALDLIAMRNNIPPLL